MAKCLRNYLILLKNLFKKPAYQIKAKFNYSDYSRDLLDKPQ